MKKPEEVLAQIAREQSPEAKISSLEKTLAATNNILKREQIVIDMLIAVGYVSRDKVNHAREIVSTLID